MQNGRDDHERRIRALEEARKELEDSFLVMTHLETKQSNVMKQQAEAIEEQRKLNQDTDKRIADLVSAIGKLISKMPGTQP